MQTSKIALYQKIRNKSERRRANGKAGAAARWSQPRDTIEDDDIAMAYDDRKGTHYGTFTRFDGVVQEFRHSTHRKDQLDVYENGKRIGRASSHNIGTILMEKV